MSAPDERRDQELARGIATTAGRMLTDLRERRGFADPAELRRLGDRRSHDMIVNTLLHQRSADAVLSEEGADDVRRLDNPRVWIVDPLDGTREFAEPGQTEWAVHVALWERGRLSAGAVALPARGSVLSTADAPCGERTRRDGPLRIAVSRTRPPGMIGALADLLHAELVPMGSAGVKIAAVVLGEVDVYVHAGGQYEWDSAAPVAVALHAGLHASRIDGSPLAYNRPDPWLPDLVVCRPERRESLLSALDEVSGKLTEVTG